MHQLKGLDKRDICYLSPRERQERMERIESSKDYLKRYKTSPFKTERDRDITPIVRQLNEDKKVLSELSAPNVSDLQKNRLLKECREMERKIKIGMPTFDEMMGKRKTNPNNSKYQEAIPSIVDKNVKWTLKNEFLVRGWKRIKRILEPDNPDATNVEQLREIH